MQGSDMVGNRQKLLALHESFFDEVAKEFGLRKGPARLSGATKSAGAVAVLRSLKATGDPALNSSVWPVLRANIEAEPAAYMLVLGIDPVAKSKRRKTFTEIAISPGKGPKWEAIPIGFTSPPSGRNLCSVGAGRTPAQPAASIWPAGAAPLACANLSSSASVETRRERDADFSSGCWDEQTGEFLRSESAPRVQKASAQRWVAQALARSVSDLGTNVVRIPEVEAPCRR